MPLKTLLLATLVNPGSFSLVGFMEDRVVDIRPELFRCERAEIQQNVGQPALSDLRPCAILGRIVGEEIPADAPAPRTSDTLKVSLPESVRVITVRVTA